MIPEAHKAEPDEKRKDLFECIEAEYQEEGHGYFKFAGGIEIGLGEGPRPMYLWFFEYFGEDQCRHCPGGIRPIVEAWRKRHHLDEMEFDIEAFEGDGNIYLIERGINIG